MKSILFISILILSFGICAQSDKLNQIDSKDKNKGIGSFMGKMNRIYNFIMIRSQLYITIIFTFISINLFSQLREGIHDGWRCDPENPLTLESDANSFIIILNETEKLKHFSMSKKPLKIIIECSGQIYKDADGNGEIPITRWDIYTMDQEFMLLEKSYKRLDINIGYVKIIRKGKFSKVEIVLYRNSENDGKPFYSEMRNLIVRKSL